jgi:hypothetical protein
LRLNVNLVELLVVANDSPTGPSDRRHPLVIVCVRSEMLIVGLHWESQDPERFGDSSSDISVEEECHAATLTRSNSNA